MLTDHIGVENSVLILQTADSILKKCNQSQTIENIETPGLIHNTYNQSDLAMEIQNQYIIDQQAVHNIVEECTM